MYVSDTIKTWLSNGRHIIATVALRGSKESYGADADGKRATEALIDPRYEIEDLLADDGMSLSEEELIEGSQLILRLAENHNWPDEYWFP